MHQPTNDMNEIARMFTEHQMDHRFLEARKIFLWGGVDDHSSERLVKQLLYLQEIDPKADIEFYINSPGGVITAGLAVYDAMQALSCDVHTICTGQAASMGAVLLTAGTAGKRSAWKHARVMIHQPLIHGRMYAPASDLEIQAEEMLRVRDELNEILAIHTGKSVETIAEDTDRDNFMNTSEAIEYGLIDTVTEP